MTDPARKERSRARLAWTAALLCSALIWFANTRPSTVRTASGFWNDVIWQGGHLLAHVALGVLTWRAATLTWGHRAGYLVTMAGTFVHAVLDEMVQYWVPTRHPNLEDVLTNIAGCALGIAAAEYARLRGWWPNHAPPPSDPSPEGRAPERRTPLRFTVRRPE